MNDVHQTIKFTFKYSATTIIDVLDISIHLGDHAKLFSKVYSKPTGTFPLLDFKSNHPVETKLSIIYSQARRYRLLTTYDEDLMKSLSRLKFILLARGYPNHMIDSKLLEASTLSQRELLFTPNKSEVVNPHPLPFVIPYHRSNKGIEEILDRNWHLIEKEPQLQLIFPNKPNIKDHLVHTRFNTQEWGNPAQTGTHRGNNPQGGINPPT